MKFRTDPLTDNGTVDMEFFNSSEYRAEQKILIDYLFAEGFDLKNENFFIDFRNRMWHIIPQKTKKKK